MDITDEQLKKLREALKAGLDCARECKLNTTYHERVMREALDSLPLPEFSSMVLPSIARMETSVLADSASGGLFYVDIVRGEQGPQQYVDGIEMIEADPLDERYPGMVDTFVSSECAPESVSHGDPLPKVSENETLHGYCYGGALSQRAGIYVTPTDEPRRILRYKGLWMS